MSDNPPQGRFAAVAQRLQALHPRLIDLSLGRLQALLDKLDHPERRLPPVVHVAGTNGKGSTCAFLRAMGEAAGQPVHVFTSPHLVRFNERIRLAGRIIDDDTLAGALDEAERINNGAPVTVFELLTATAFLLFSRVPAGLVVLEVGLGGRYDATNVIPPPAAAAITSVSMDHRDFLGTSLAAIAGEKAGIMKPGVVVATGLQAPAVRDVLRAEARSVGARLLERGRDWTILRTDAGLIYEDVAGALALPPPALPGPHQVDNAGIAIAAVRAGVRLPDDAIASGLATATWPARLQRLHGRLSAMLPYGWELWLDGGHNPGAGLALAGHLAASDQPTHLIVGMKKGKDFEQFPPPAAAPGRDHLGGDGTRPAPRHAGGRHHVRLGRGRPARPDRDRRPGRHPAARSARPRADLRQPVSRRRGAEGRRHRRHLNTGAGAPIERTPGSRRPGKEQLGQAARGALAPLSSVRPETARQPKHHQQGHADAENFQPISFFSIGSKGSTWVLFSSARRSESDMIAAPAQPASGGLMPAKNSHEISSPTQMMKPNRLTT